MAKLDIGHIFTNPDLEDGQAQFDELPPEAIAHLIAAYKHKAGLSPHPGKYEGPEVKNPNVPKERS
jgi:hypothetical protein